MCTKRKISSSMKSDVGGTHNNHRTDLPVLFFRLQILSFCQFGHPSIRVTCCVIRQRQRETCSKFFAN